MDWKHVVEEIEDVGISQLNAVQSHLRLLLVRLYRSAREQISVAGYAEREPLLPPETCPFTLDQLLNESGRSLQAMLASV